jgi:S1-C subfamily serine protease
VAAVLVTGGVVASVFLLGSQDQPESVASSSVPGSTSTSIRSITTSPDGVTTVAQTPVALSPAQIGERFGDAVWRVDVEGCGDFSSGSSFAISPTHLVTNHHVVAFDSTPTLVSRNGETLEGRVLGSAPIPDVAVIEVSGTLPTQLEWASPDAVSLGDPIVTLGYPAPDGDFTVTPGNVLSFGTEEGFGRFIRTDGQIDFGNSGGPALDSFGDVVGIVTSLEANPTGAQIVPQIYSSDVVRPEIDAMLEGPTYPDPSCDEGFPADQLGDFWTAILASLPDDQFDGDYADDWAADFYSDTGISAEVLWSTVYGTLSPGYWVVYSGYFGTSDAAKAHCETISSLGYDCYTKFVAWFPDDPVEPEQ